MLKFIGKSMNKKGFTLVELIVVIAILGLLSAIAIPKLVALRHESKVKAEGSSAVSIVNAARIQETNEGVVVTEFGEDEGQLKARYMEEPSGVTFTITGGGDDPYVVTWDSAAIGYVGEQKYEERTEFKPESY